MAAEYELYGYFRSSTSYRIRIALNLKGLVYTQISVNLKTLDQRKNAFGQISPYKTVPALKTEGGTLYQSLAILDWLEAYHPQPSFLPDDSDALLQCKELYYAVATEIHAVNNQPVLLHLKEKYGASQDALEAWNSKWIEKTFAPVEERLTSFAWQSRELPFGKPTLFEIVLVPQIYNAHRWKVDLSRFPKICAIDEACGEQQAFVDAHPNNQPDAQ